MDRKIVSRLLVAVLALFPVLAFAAGLAEQIDGIATGVNEYVISGLIMGVIELVLRLKASQKPLSFLWLGVGLLKKGLAIVAAVVRLMEAVAKKADQVLPQNVKPADPK